MYTGVICYGIFTAEREFEDYVAVSKHVVMTMRDDNFIIIIIFPFNFPPTWFSWTIQYAIMKVQENQVELNLLGHKKFSSMLMVYISLDTA
jgi:hypothetical protein